MTSVNRIQTSPARDPLTGQIIPHQCPLQRHTALALFSPEADNQNLLREIRTTGKLSME